MQFLILPLVDLRGNCGDLLFVNGPSSSMWYDIFELFLRFEGTFCVADFMGYCSHRLLHEVNWLYQRVHKVHHQFVNVYAITTTACHPLEYVFVDTFTVFGAPIITGLPIIPYGAFLTLGYVSVCIGHSGYGNPFSGVPVVHNVPHDHHHHYQDCEFGNREEGIADWSFGTRFQDKHPKRYRELQREYGVFTVAAVKENGIK